MPRGKLMMNNHQSCGSYDLSKWSKNFKFSACSDETLTRSQKRWKKRINIFLTHHVYLFSSVLVLVITDQKRSLPSCKFIFVTFILVVFFYFKPCFNFIYRRSIDFEEYLHQGKHYIKTLRTKCTCMSGSSTPQFIPRIYITFCWPMALYTDMHD